MNPINSRADLENLRGTAALAIALRNIAGSSMVLFDVAERPSDYGEPSYEGPTIEPIWENRQDNAVLRRFSLTRRDLDAELAATKDSR